MNSGDVSGLSTLVNLLDLWVDILLDLKLCGVCQRILS